MFLEADTELDEIDPFNRAAPEVLALRIAIYRGLEKWELMQELANRLAEFQPDDIHWTISLAYATRRIDSIQAAKEILMNAEPKFPKDAAIKYNLACYFCQTGDLQNAKNYLKKACKNTCLFLIIGTLFSNAFQARKLKFDIVIAEYIS